MKRALIVLNGRPPGRRLIRSLSQQADLIIAADGGSNALIEAEIPFHAVVGDMDSADKKKLAKLKKVQLVEEHEQEDTDFEKTLRWVLRSTNSRDVIYTGGMGEEFDHVLTHLSIACKYSSRLKLRQVEDNVIIYFVCDNLDLNLRVGSQLSLIAMGKAEGIRTTGLKWQLNGETLEFGRRDGLHNVVEQKEVSIKVRDGCLAVMQHKTKGEAFRW